MIGLYACTWEVTIFEADISADYSRHSGRIYK